MLRQGLVDRLGIVLRHDGQEHAVVSQPDVVLEVPEALPDSVFAERDAADAIVPDDTSPQRVVEIEHEHLPRAVQRNPSANAQLPADSSNPSFEKRMRPRYQ